MASSHLILQKQGEVDPILTALIHRIDYAHGKHPEGANMEALKEEFFEAYDEHCTMLITPDGDAIEKAQARLATRMRYESELLDVMTVAYRLIQQSEQYRIRHG